MNNLFFFTLLLAIIILTGCPDDPVRPKPDPCEGKMPVTADFTISQQVNDYFHGSRTYIKTDIVTVDRYIKFEAHGEYDSYQWQLEDDTTLYIGKASVFLFKYPWGELKMRLIVGSKPDTLCFPDDDGIDTIYKSIFVINKENIDLIGSYHGYLENDPSDTFSVDIKYEGYDKGLVIYNINPGCFIPTSNNYNMIRVGFVNHIAFFNGNGGYGYGCESPLGQAELQKDKKTIIIDYESGPSTERKKYKFIGVKK